MTGAKGAYAERNGKQLTNKGQRMTRRKAEDEKKSFIWFSWDSSANLIRVFSSSESAERQIYNNAFFYKH